MGFNIVDENSVFKLGNIISIFKLPNNDREIALFTITALGTEDPSLNIAYINKDKEGYDYLEEIKDKKVFNEAMLVAKDIIKTMHKKKK